MKEEIEEEIWKWLLSNPLNSFKSEEEKVNLARLDFINFVENNTIKSIEEQYNNHLKMNRPYERRNINS